MSHTMLILQRYITSQIPQLFVLNNNEIKLRTNESFGSGVLLRKRLHVEISFETEEIREIIGVFFLGETI